jgi:hypothetical protein
MQILPVKGMLLETVWSRLSEDRWLEAGELKAASGADENTLMRVVEFLVRWNFAEVRKEPNLQVKRRPGAISPTDVVRVLRAAQETPELKLAASNGVFRLAERFACRMCGGGRLRVTGRNEVECKRCHERQWYAIDVNRGRRGYEREGMLKRLLVRKNVREL